MTISNHFPPAINYDRGVQILNDIYPQAKRLGLADLACKFQKAVYFFEHAIKGYKDNHDHDNVQFTYKVLVNCLETHIADELHDIAGLRAAENDLVPAKFCYELAKFYYLKAIELNEYSKTPVLDLHFSVLNTLEDLSIIYPAKKTDYYLDILHYISQNNLEYLVLANSKKAQTYRVLLQEYFELIGIKVPQGEVVMAASVYSSTRSITLFASTSDANKVFEKFDAREQNAVKSLEEFAEARTTKRQRV